MIRDFIMKLFNKNDNIVVDNNNKPVSSELIEKDIELDELQELYLNMIQKKIGI